MDSQHRAGPTCRTARRAAALAAAAAAVACAPPAVAPPRVPVAAAPGDPTALVNPFVGTAPGDTDFGTGGGAGNTFPGADVPFGMVQWSPDTVRTQPGGYYYGDDRIRGFSLTHFSGAGCKAFGDIPILPVSAPVTTSPATDPGRYTARFSHDHEMAEPGYYGVALDGGPTVELTATQHAGVGRFTFPADRPATVLVDVSGSATGTDDASVTVGRDTVSGWASSGDFCHSGNHYRVYFSATFDRPFTVSGTWHDGSVERGRTASRGGPSGGSWGTRAMASGPGPHPASPGAAARLDRRGTTVAGPGSGAWVGFDPSDGPVVVRIGLSFVDVAGAARNARAEVGTPRPATVAGHRAGGAPRGNPHAGGDQVFDGVRTRAHDAWASRLRAVLVDGGTTAERTNFYTALYHCFVQPNVISDVDGRYPGFDGRVHTVASGHAQYANFSGWDVYRSQVQLLALLAPAEASDVGRSLLAQAEQGGSWDRWSQANGYTGVMVGDPYHSMMASLYAFGARDFDARAALASMVRGATEPTGERRGYQERPGLSAYLAKGYVPTGEPQVWGAAATTLEYTTADFGIAQLAGMLGENAIRDRFMARAQSWQNLFDPVSGYLRPRRADGSFEPHFDPASPNGYVEGNGAQYTWMVPYDVRGLVEAMGGDAAVRARLDRFFGRLDAGPKEPYAFLGNEPSLGVPWLYDYTGAPYRTQAVVRQAVDTLYHPTPGGYVGNDDLGEMSSWYVWAAMGMYPQIPGRSELLLTSPLFPRVRVQRPTGAAITVTAPGAAADRPYVTGLRVDGQTSTRPWLPADFVNTGGTLDYTLSSAPDTAWGAAASDAPPSFRDGETPVRAFTDPTSTVVAPGSARRITVGALRVSGTDAAARWNAEVPAGLSVSPTSGRLHLGADGRATTRLTVAAAAAVHPGYYPLPLTVTDGAGRTSRAVVTVVVAAHGSALEAYDNVGVCDDDTRGAADLDGHGYCYSAQALAAAGVHPGGTVRAGGFAFTWPDVPRDRPDNIVAHGQTLDLSGVPAGATELSLLGSATNGPSRGTVTLTYTDGSTSRAGIGFADWTRGSTGQVAAAGDVIAVAMPYRIGEDGEADDTDTYVYATAPVPLAPGRRLASVTLPRSVDRGLLHVFAVAVGTPRHP